MADFSKPALPRDQLVLFSEKLDDVIRADHEVRLLDDILRKVDWTSWEAQYDLTRGRPPIHPRVVASAILYGLLKRIRSSRAVEEALESRNDFRWLVEGRSIDHTTIAIFRQQNSEQLKQLFVQVVLVARELGHVRLASLGFDGTRMRANNRRSGTRTAEDLRRAKAELEARYKELEEKAAAADAQEDQELGGHNGYELAEELADVERRRKRVDAALAELERIAGAGEKVPARLPITDPESRVSPNKDGGFAPNYTPTATVDIDSGLIVDAQVIASTDEDKVMMDSVDNVQRAFGLEQPPGELLADGMMSTGENLAACQEKGIDLYSPIKLGSSEDNPARREDPTQPVAEEDWDRLPTTRTKRKKDGTESVQLNKEAFVYDQEQDCYWCPAGKPLPYANRTSQVENGRQRIRYRYKADPTDCAACPLKSLCLGARAKQRQISHEQNEELRLAHAKKMATEEAKRKYARRRHPGERPFAMIKAHFGARRFLTRGLKRVRTEWLWLTTAFNLHRLMSLLRAGAGPIHSGAGPPRGALTT
jgi:transposase